MTDVFRKLTMSLDLKLSFAKVAKFVRHTILFYQMVTKYFKNFGIVLACTKTSVRTHTSDAAILTPGRGEKIIKSGYYD